MSRAAETPWRLPPGALVLASRSPRREQLLRAHGLRFQVAPQSVDERWRGEKPEAFARRLALEKAGAAAVLRPRAWCLGADTVVVIGTSVLGKPRSRAHARRMLSLLSGRTHRVVTAVALVGPGFRSARVVATRVRFRRMSASEIAWYAATGEPDDKAGAYAAQGKGGMWIASIQGDWWNVIGLPLGATRELLSRAAGRSARG